MHKMLMIITSIHVLNVERKKQRFQNQWI